MTIGHGAVIHACSIQEACLIGMNATVLSGAIVGEGSLIAAGALVAQGAVIPPHSLVAGIPGRVIRPLTDEDRASVRHNSAVYLEYTSHHRDALGG